MKTNQHPDRRAARGLFNHTATLCCIALAALVSGCSAETATPKTADGSASAMNAEQINKLKANPEVKALLDKTLKNMRFVEGGSFEMGDFGPKHSAEKMYYTTAEDNKPPWKVTLDSFSMSAFKTTYEDYDVFSRAMGRELVAQKRRSRFPTAAAGVNWHEARDYCRWLGAMLNLPVDLPTEAQWEYAARNRGQLVLFPTDNGKIDLKRNVWEFDQRNAAVNKMEEAAGKSVGLPASLPLGQFPPTPLGFYDLITDGFEWMLDWYDLKLPEKQAQNNPKGLEHGTHKVLRSSRSTDGVSLSNGEGMTFHRWKREPDPPTIDVRSDGTKQVLDVNSSTTARCVLNQPIPASAVR